MHTVEEDNPLINIIVYYSLYHHVGMAMVHDDKYPHTGRTLYSVNGLCCCKENYNTKKEIQSISDAKTCYGRLMCCEHFVQGHKIRKGRGTLIAHLLSWLPPYLLHYTHSSIQQ